MCAMKLLYSAFSPFVRKVIITAKLTKQFDKLETVPVAVGPTAPNMEVAKQNPLMKLPTLVINDSFSLYESSLICQYLDDLHKEHRVVPLDRKWEVLRLEALADGITDAGVLLRYEDVVRKPEQRNQEWIDGQMTKVRNGLDWLEAQPEAWMHGTGKDSSSADEPLDLGQIAVACGIAWLEFRRPCGVDVRTGRPRLTAWYENISKRPEFMETAPHL